MGDRTGGFYRRYLLNNRLYILFIVIQYLILVAGISFFCSLDFTGYQLLYLFSRWNYYISVLFALFAYIIFTESTRNSCEEVIDSITKKKLSWQRGIGGTYAKLLLGYHFVLLAGIIITSLKNDGTSYLLGILPRTYLMNIVFPQVILLGMVFIASCISSTNKMLSYSLVLFFCIMTSPLFEQLIWRERPNGFPIDGIVNIIKWPFYIFYKNAEWVPDTQYGLQVENVRLYVQLFWLALITGAIIWLSQMGEAPHLRNAPQGCAGIRQGRCQLKLIRIPRQDPRAGLEKGYKKLSAVWLSLSLFFLILSYFPASIYRLDEAWDGIFADLYYYQNGSLDIQEVQEPDYKISKYKLRVDVNNELTVEGSLTIDAPVETDEFVFTLYHGYEIKKLEVNGSTISFDRNGDSIIISLPEKVKTFELVIEYGGSSGKYYSNSMAIMLPGYFPWYPMAGEKQVFVQYPYYNGGNGYNPYNRISPADFEVDINTDCSFVTNLSNDHDNVFTGTSDSLTIIGGNIIPVENDSVIEDYLPLELSNIDGDKYIEERIRSWESGLEEAESVFGINVDELKTKKIILASEDLGRNFSNNNIIEFGDYILASADYLNSRDYLTYRLHEQGKNSKIGDLFCHALLQCDDLDADEIIRQMITIEGENQQMLEELEGTQENQKISGRLESITRQIGAETFVKEMVSYLLSDSQETDEAFFEYLYAKYEVDAGGHL